jgi:hypothetical protein
MRALSFQLLSGVLAALAGFLLYVYVTNRYRRRLRLRGVPVLMFVLGLLLVATLGGAVLGFALGPGPWLLAPIMVIAVAAVREIHRRWLRGRCRGEGPVETHNLGLSLARPITTRDVALARYEVSVPACPLGRLRVAVISDLHVGKALELEYYEGVFEAVARQAPDLMVLPGDFVASTRSLPFLPPVLRLCRAPIGVFAVRGNHDFWSDSRGVAEALAEAGIRLLCNETAVLHLGRARVVLTGCEDPWARPSWQPPVSQPGDLVLAIAHTADNIYRLSRAGITAVFCGHYHAGQARVPGWGPVFVPSRYGRRFDHGHFMVHGTHLFVSAGIGASGPVVRIYCQPDVFLVDFLGNQSLDCPEPDTAASGDARN